MPRKQAHRQIKKTQIINKASILNECQPNYFKVKDKKEQKKPILKCQFLKLIRFCIVKNTCQCEYEKPEQTACKEWWEIKNIWIVEAH